MIEQQKIQYISQGAKPEDHLTNIQKVCEAGIRWVQLRIKDVDFETYLQIAKESKKICAAYSAVFIVNDNVSIAKESEANGVHLGLSDMNPKDARSILGDHSIIGGTANTLQDCLLQAENKVDYIGLGPFRHTETKKNLSPVLGLEGYRKIITELRAPACQIPVIATGGILESDIKNLMENHVSGIAVSKLLTQNLNLKTTVDYIQVLLKKA